MSDIVSRPYTPEGEETWERVFIKKLVESSEKNKARIFISAIAKKNIDCGDLVTLDDIEKL